MTTNYTFKTEASKGAISLQCGIGITFSAGDCMRQLIAEIRRLHSVESRDVTRLESMNLSNALSSQWVGHRPMANSKPLAMG